MSVRTAKAAPDSGRLELGRTVPSLLEEAVRTNPNDRAFNERDGAGGWRVWSTSQFAREAEDLALGLRAAGLTFGSRVGLFTDSDMSFVLGDMACQIAGLVDVPIYLTHTPAAIRHILTESECQAVLVSTAEQLAQMESLTADIPGVKLLGVYDRDALAGHAASAAWAGRRITSYATLAREGAEQRTVEPGRLERFRRELVATDMCTIIYTSGTTGTPKGVMLSHQNLTSNAIASLTGIPEFRPGAEETVLSFLPLSHIFARTLQYATIWYGSTTYYGTPNTVGADLLEVRPTFMAAVPRVLEKLWEKLQAAGDELTGVKSVIYRRALAFARAFDVTVPVGGLARTEQRFLDRLVYSKWREALGGRLRLVIVGGAALRPELANIVGAAGIDVLEGYGLTETSPVMTFNRPGRNRPGTVGEPIVGTEVGVSDEGEVLARGPHVMLGYYKRPSDTAEAIDEDGWFHTGDLGDLDGRYLSITGRLKYLFKLSTGKYVMPQPITDRLEGDPLIDTAIIAGPGQKYCTALIFLSRENLQARYGRADDSVLTEPKLTTELAAAIRAANEGMPHWSTVKRAAVVTEELTMESGEVTPKLSVKRQKVLDRYHELMVVLHAEGRQPPGVLFVSVD